MANRYLSITRTLVYCDGPQLIMGEDGRRIKFLALAIPHPRLAHEFLAVQVSDEMLSDYMAESIDLRFVFRRPIKKVYFTFSLDNDRGGRYLLSKVETVDEEWLPEAGFFAHNHTEIAAQEADIQHAQATLEIGIDGRWDIQDLAQFPNKFADVYSFLHATESAIPKNGDVALGDIFERYPWRGGFSSVGFYNDLYSRIPRAHRLAVKEIRYASPGKIKITALPSIAEKIESLVKTLNHNWQNSQKAYRDLHNGMSERKLLGLSHRELDLKESDIDFLESAIRALCTSMGFKSLVRVHKLAGSDWLATAKIIASFYRRIEELGEFYESGKANFGHILI